MSRLPVVGSDTSTWGTILNDFLSQSLNTDGTLKTSAVQLANGGFLYPSNFGVIGDGTTDDTVNMQAAFNGAAAAKKTLFLPPATYKVSSVNVPSAGSLFLLGTPGSVFRHAPGATLPIIYYAQGSPNTNGLRIQGIRFQGNGYDAQTTVTGAQTLTSQPLLVGSTAGFSASGQFIVGNSFYSYTSLNATHFNGVTGTFAAGATVSQELQKAGVFVTGINDVRITDCEFDGFMDGATLMYGCRRYWIRWNKMTNCTTAGGRNCIHVDADFSDSSNPAKMGDGLIIGNYVDTGQTGAIIVTCNAGANTLRNRSIISHNIIHNYTSWAGIAMEAGYVHSGSIFLNQVYGCQQGIVLSKNDSTFSGQETVNYQMVSNNLIDAETLNSGQGIVVEGRGIAVVGNVIRSAKTGINMSNSASGLYGENMAVTGNTIVISNTDSTLRDPGIFGSGNRNCEVSGNTILRETTGTGMGSGIAIQSGTDIGISNNTMRQVGQFGISLDRMTRADVEENKVIDCNQLNLSASCMRVTSSDRVRFFANRLTDTGTATPATSALFVAGGVNTNISQEYNVYDGVSGPTNDNAAQITTSRGNRTSTMKYFNSGVSTQTPGAVSTVTIAHGLGGTPRAGATVVSANEANARGAPAYFITVDATNITLNFASSLTAATSYSWNWVTEA